VQDVDALLLPGYMMNPDKLRMQLKAIAYVKAFFDAGKRWRQSATSLGP
jgi:protease I